MILLTFQTAASWNMHHDFGASSERRQTTVSLTLSEDGTATAADVGSIRDLNLYQDGRTTEEVKAWSSAWSGTWTRRESTLTVTLQPTGETCTIDGAPCPVTPGAVVLACTRQALDIEPAAEGWVCRAEQGTPHTGLPWVLVEGRCVSDVRGKFSRSGGLTWCE